MGSITSIHDTFIRAILADKRIALDYFQASLPVFVRERLDFSSLTQLPDSYVSSELHKTISDIVYSCRRKDGKGDIKVSLLIEHKSYVDKFTPLQIGSYIFSGLLKQAENEKKLSPIIPVLLYHGKEKWEYRTLQYLFKDIEPEWAKYIPDFDYIYNNLSEVSDEQLEMLHNNFLKASLLTLKHSFEKDWLEANAVRLLAWSENTDENLQKGFVVYLFEQSKLKGDKILKIMEALPTTIRKTVKSTVDYLREEGELAKAKKVVRNLIKVSNLSDMQIAAAAEISVEDVERIRKEIMGG